MITDSDGAVTQLEGRALLDSLDGLFAMRRQLLPEYAALRAMHGTFGKWDTKRKAMLEATKIRARMVCEEKGIKITEGLIDAMGHGDEQYIAFINEGIAQATRYVELEIAMSEIEERIRNREFSMTAYSAEARLQR